MVNTKSNAPLDKWIVGEGATSGQWYVMHNKPPRFLARTDEQDDGTIELLDLVWFDPPPTNPQVLARLARLAGELLADYDLRRLEGDTIGQRIRSTRQNAGLSVAGLAAELAVSEQQLYRWERDAEAPSRQRLIDLGEVLGVSAGWLLEG